MNKKKEKEGWDYITDTFEKIYPKQTEPLHYGSLISWQLGGDDPLEGISVYDGGDFWHFVTYGFSELYEKESENKEYSGYGFELTVKLKKSQAINEEELNCMAGVLQALARYVFENGVPFLPYEYIYTGQEHGMDRQGKSKITGFGTMPDPAGTIQTPNGKIQFIQLVGLTDKELKAIYNKKVSVEEILKKLNTTLTDYDRQDII
ncbi:MAG: suppressor of fused domain protein [Tannerellaceae bacterium]|nr:suppressor of fused domain protein [Tannerellaceae bacterium]